MPALVAVLLSLQAGEGPVVTGKDPANALRIQVSGQVHLDYVYRDGAVNHAGGVMNATVPLETRSTNAWSGIVSIRLEAEVGDQASGVVEVENRRFDEGLNRPFSSDPERDDLYIKQGYINLPEFLAPALGLRIGVQDLTYRNRPHDEPFFMDLGESEGFFEGVGAGDVHVRNTVDRDLQEATGVRVDVRPAEILLLQAAALVYAEGGPSSSDESIYLLTANGLLSERTAVWLQGVLVSGGDADLDQIWTAGAGVNTYFGEQRQLELFGEAYVQGGTLVDDPRTIDKKAYAGQAGARYFGLLDRTVWLEAAASHRSGNAHVTDDTDGAFQSYENVNRFVILQSAEFGLDVDTNVTVIRGALGLGPFEVAGRPLRLQIDVGRFEAVHALRNAAGGVLTASDEDDWGVETDVTVSFDFNESVTLALKGAWLGDSDILEDLARDDDAALGLFSADLKF